MTSHQFTVTYVDYGPVDDGEIRLNMTVKNNDGTQ